jgi:hypothetical protein
MKCDGCDKPLLESSPRFHYSDGVVACETCAPTFEEAEQGFRRACPAAWQFFVKRKADHLAVGGKMSDKFLNAP